MLSIETVTIVGRFCPTPEIYDRHVRANFLLPTSSRCIGILHGSEIEVIIDEQYYLRGGIKPEELGALVEHERVEIMAQDSDPHLAGTIAEYRFILKNWGLERLHQYDACMRNLMGGRNDIRDFALAKALEV